MCTVQFATLPLIPAVCDAVSPTPVVAGGIADGRGLAAVLALGASGAWIGTEGFLAAPEAGIHPRYQERLLDATEDSTVHTTLFDIGWPDAPHRVLRNTRYDRWIAAGKPASGKRPGEGEVIAIFKRLGNIVRYRSYTPGADADGSVESLSLWAGQSVGLVSSVKSASEIVREIVSQADAIVHRIVGIAQSKNVKIIQLPVGSRNGA